MSLLNIPSRALRLAQIVCAVIFCLTTAGVVFGFAALKPVLIKKGVYRELCTASDGNPMIPRTCDLKLNFMFTLAAVVTNVFCLPIGVLLDRVGPQLTTLLGAAVFGLGNFFFGLEVVTPCDGYILLSIGGPTIYLSTFHLSNTFPTRSGLILSLIIGGFNCSAFPYLIYRAIDEIQEISIRSFFWGYISIPVLAIMEQIALGPQNSYKEGDFKETECRDFVSAADENSPLLPEGSPMMKGNDDPRDSEHDGEIAVREPFTGVMTGKPVREQLLSSYYWTRINYFIQTVFQQMLFYLKDHALAESVATSFTVLLPLGGVVGVPIIGWILDKKGVGFTSLVIFFSGILYGVLGIMPSPPMQLTSIAIFVVLRPLIYTFLSDYIGKAFGYETFGTVYGLLNCIAGLFGLILRPIDVFAKNTLHGDYTVVNVVGIILGAISATIISWRIYHQPLRGAVNEL
ncbi:major facilitator superfamily domain-containing protein [Cantharellus anzutake]|uniref:major facilitator superfamily domain-containing protein n=1 Tax=Cantharellus anzutake TaxID=1750568 RepID=UPI0019046D42|nr:major facilitator superfamily domain-containing protein [Cantharellus anzutake]KAF8338999.1 major facilitator superfamily domain-containing protein [Cantharellus anzutake]